VKVLVESLTRIEQMASSFKVIYLVQLKALQQDLAMHDQFNQVNSQRCW